MVHATAPLAVLIVQAATYLAFDLDDDPAAAKTALVEWIARDAGEDEPTIQELLDEAMDVGIDHVSNYTTEEYERIEGQLAAVWTSRANGTPAAPEFDGEIVLTPSDPFNDLPYGNPRTFPAPVVTILPSGVPQQQSTSNTREYLLPEQERYLDEVYIPALQAGVVLHPEDTEAYGVQALRELVYQRYEDIPRFETMLDALCSSYRGTDLRRYARRIQIDVMLAEGRFRDAWQSYRGQWDMPLGFYLAFAEDFSDDARVTVGDLDRWFPPSERRLTIPGQGEMLDDIEDAVRVLLDDHHHRHGRSMVLDWWEQLGDRRKYQAPRTSTWEAWRYAYATQIDWPRFPADVSPVRDALYGRYAELFRAAENIVRRTRGIPAIGEGWASEATLLRRLREAFPGEVIVHQGSPSWLRPQRFDAWFPERNVAVEYQGLQHFQPVSLFGGEEGFKRTQERDARKRALCTANGCALFEVLPDYDFDELRQTLVAQFTTR